jgi:Tol biopolymer transport system component
MLCQNCGKENEEGYKFCMYCGNPITQAEEPVDQSVAQESELEPASSQPEPQAEEPPPAPVEPSPAPVEPTPARSQAEEPIPTVVTPRVAEVKVPPPPVPDKKKAPFYKKPGFLLSVVIAAVVIFVIGAVIYGIITNRSEQLYYAVQEHRPDDQFDSIMNINSKGKGNKEVASEPGGLIPAISNSGIVDSVFAPDQNHIALFGLDDQLIYIYTVKDGDSYSVNEDSNSLMPAYGFSPDSRYYAYTTYDQERNDLTTYVVDEKGEEVLNVEGAVFGTFTPDGNKVVVIEVDSNGQQATAITSVDIKSGESNTLTDIDQENYTQYTNIKPFPAPDGKSVYYMQGKELLSVPMDGGSPDSVYEFEDARSFAFAAPDRKHLVILDYDAESNLMDLIILDPKSGDQTRIDKYVLASAFLPDIYSFHPLYGESPIMFSPNGKNIAYMLSKSGTADLYVSDLKRDTRNKIASNAGWFTFDFTPNGARIVYIESSDPNTVGDLYIVDKNGENRQRLDTDVWSFKILNNGKKIVYFKVSDLDRDKPETEMYTIQTNGKNKQQITEADYGLFTFLR